MIRKTNFRTAWCLILALPAIVNANSTQIFFSAQPDSPLGGGLYSIDPSGVGLQQRISTSSPWWSYAVAQDGSKIYAEPLTAYGHFQAYNSAGTYLGNIGSGIDATRSGTPWLDSTHMLCNNEVLDTANGSETALTLPLHYGLYGMAAINTTEIAWGSQDTSGGPPQLHILNLATNQDELISEPSVAELYPTSYSASGNWLYCQGYSSFSPGNDQGWNVYRVHPDGTGFQDLTGVTDHSFAFAPEVSPDGSQIAYMYQTSGSWWENGDYSLMVMNSDGSDAHPVLSGYDLFGTGFTQHSPIVWTNQSQAVPGPNSLLAFGIPSVGLFLKRRRLWKRAN